VAKQFQHADKRANSLTIIAGEQELESLHLHLKNPFGEQQVL
jgi:histidyl-tRNA synthetase